MENKVTILVVDDNHENLRLVSNYLMEQDYRLALALNGNEALTVLDKIQPDLILLDVMMPGMDGFELCRLLKKNEKTAEIPIIFLTAKSQPEDIVEGFEAGGVDYVSKPFNRQELLARIRNQVDLALARNQIREMSQTRDKLFSIIAHDIKSPFSTIIFALNLINQGVFDKNSEEFNSLMVDLETTTKATKALIDNILEWTKFQNGKNMLKIEANDISVLIHECALLLSSNAKEKNIEVAINTPEKLTALFDEVSMHTILRNLIANAIKFTNPGGRVTIETTEINDKIKVIIKDNGVGMSPEVIKKAFESADHFSTMGTGKEKGTGLGLVLVKEFVQKNRGKLAVKSLPGEGTEVSIELNRN